ncbi:MAG: phage holin family protein [Bacteroidetes bacterium]|nr:phage holin family protein [Bacteroidota bacterium]
MAEAWPQKVATASLGAGLIQLAEYVAGLYGRLFEADPLLVLLCFTLLLVDAITGVAAAIKRGEKVSSRAFRRTGWKVLEYTALGAAMVMIANAFSHTWAHYVTDGLDEAALLYIAFTEALSIVENVTGSRAAAMRVIRKIVRIRDEGPDGVLTVEEIVTKKPMPPADSAPEP